ncbi:hypothetical protein LTR36_001464, partial [Oleoguttula mirabilis]
PVQVEGGYTVIYRYELEYTTENDGQAVLVGKKKATPVMERENLQGNVIQAIRDQYFPKFDEVLLNDYLGRSTWSRLFDHQLAGMVAHRLGFALLCGFPLKYHRNQPDQYFGYAERTFIVLKLIDWLHMYGSFKKTSAEVERFILGVHVGPEAIRQFPHTFLRIAVLLEAQDLYQLALANAVSIYDSNLRNDSTFNNRVYAQAYQVLNRELGSDVQLSGRVTSMHAILATKQAALQSELLALASTEHPKTTSRLATAIRREWFSRKISDLPRKYVPYNFFGRVIERIATSQVDAEDLIEQYKLRHYSGAAVFPPHYIQKAKLRDVLSTLIRSAQGILEGALNSEGGFAFVPGGVEPGGCYQLRRLHLSVAASSR